MLSPSHPGPYKATHLAMCDRTLVQPLSSVALFFISNSVGVNCGSRSTYDSANDCALLTTSRCAYRGACASSDSGG